jgi:hypothetical protein
LQKANLTLQSKPKSANTTEYKYIAYNLEKAGITNPNWIYLLLKRSQLVLQKANLKQQSKPKSANTTEYKYIPVWRGQELPTEIGFICCAESKSETAVQT